MGSQPSKAANSSRHVATVVRLQSLSWQCGQATLSVVVSSKRHAAAGQGRICKREARWQGCQTAVKVRYVTRDQ
jgi:hypothetical protein